MTDYQQILRNKALYTEKDFALRNTVLYEN